MRSSSRASHYQYRYCLAFQNVKLTHHFAGGTRLGAYFSVYLTGEEQGTPDSDPPPESSSSASSSSTG